MSNLNITSQVKADTSNGTLDVEDHGKAISVPQEPDSTKLFWTLSGAGPNAAFNAIDLSDPDTSGFSWAGRSDGSSPPGFQPPTLSPSGNQISMEDNNNGNGTAGGPYTYTLRAMVNGTACVTTSSVSPRGTVNNPKIENK